MSITDELREYANTRISPNKGMLLAIADRIDAEHEAQLNDAFETRNSDENLESDGWIRLPKDADGEYIHIGDEMVSKDGKVHRVDSLTRNPTWFDYEWSIRLALLNDGVGAGSLVRYRPDTLRHHHAPTVEDVLREFGIDWEHESDCEDRAALLAEYAAKLQLKEDE